MVEYSVKMVFYSVHYLYLIEHQFTHKKMCPITLQFCGFKANNMCLPSVNVETFELNDKINFITLHSLSLVQVYETTFFFFS